MTKLDFDKFVQRQQGKSQKTEVFDSQLELREWQAALENLYQKIHDYMIEYINGKQAAITYRIVQLNEEFSGPYEAKEMLLKVGPSTISFTPVGTMLIGSKGRVDVTGPHGSTRLVRMDRKIERASQFFKWTVTVVGESSASIVEPTKAKIDWTWKLATPPPDLRFVELDQESFFDMMLSIADA
jgi:hypothetical protein